MARQRLVKEVQRTLAAMRDAGLRLDVIHWGAASRAFEKRSYWSQSLAMLKRADGLGLPTNEFFFSSALRSCAESGVWAQALGVAEASSRRGLLNDVLTSGIISALSYRWQLSLRAFEQSAAHAEPSDFAFTAVISCQGQAKRWYAAVSTLGSMSAARIDPPLVSHSAAVDAFAWGREWSLALRVLAHLPTASLVPNLIAFNSALSACEKGYQWQATLAVLDCMEVAVVTPELISHASAISSCEKGSQWQLALHLLHRLENREVDPDAVALCAAMSACEKAGEWQIALALLGRTLRRASPRSAGFAASAAVGAAAKAAAWEAAVALFVTLPSLRAGATGILAGSVAGALKGACSEDAAVKFVTSTRELWEHSAKDGNNIETGELSMETAGDVAVDVLCRAPGILALAKPADIRTEVLVGAACERFAEELFLVSRLDHPTSGVLPLATSPRALHWLQAQFAGRLVQKEYVCLCHGASLGPPGTTGQVDAPLQSLLIRTQVSPLGRAAKTEYEVLACFAGQGDSVMSLLSVHPLTGRMHQIRAHLASIERPLVGDAIYGAQREQGLPKCPRLFLHCRRLQLLDLEGQQIVLEAELSESLRTYLASLTPLTTA